MHTFTRWVTTPENRSALIAAQRVADCLGSGRRRREINPLFLHGPAGTGKTHLVAALAGEVQRRCPGLTDTIHRAGDLNGFLSSVESNENAACTRLTDWEGDLLVVEDLQHLRPEAAEALVQVFDRCLSRQQQMVFTALVGPRRLTHLPARLTSRLACGLVVGLEPFGRASRLAFLQDRAQRRQLAVGPDVLDWLAEHTGGSARQLEGAIARLEELARLHQRLPDRDTVAQCFRDVAEASGLTVERIAEQVGRYFRIDGRQLRSRQRSRSALVPRQVSMYLARRLTGLSLEQIGAYFGGRDHSTVLHACRKIGVALTRDPTLAGVVRQLQAELA